MRLPPNFDALEQSLSERPGALRFLFSLLLDAGNRKFVVNEGSVLPETAQPLGM
jgi:hypothetical protein